MCKYSSLCYQLQLCKLECTVQVTQESHGLRDWPDAFQCSGMAGHICLNESTRQGLQFTDASIHNYCIQLDGGKETLVSTRNAADTHV